MARLNLNIFANFSGQAWGMALSLIFTPLYIHALGVESYGLIGVYLVLLGLVQVFDFGLGPTINRELSRRFHAPGDRRHLKTLVRTAEIIYLLLAIFLAVLIMCAADALAGSWINVSELNRANVKHIVVLMSVLLGLQWPMGLYQNVLMGMQEQPTANILNGTYATVANVLAAVLIVSTRSGVEVYFICVAIVSVFQLLHLRRICWKKLGTRDDSALFRFDVLRNTAGFTAGMAGISVVSVLLTQLDKILLSKLLSLSDFGLYLLAGTLSRALYVLITPVYSAVFPRLSSAIAQNDFATAIRIYHSAAQLMAVLVLSAAFSLAIFSHDVFLLWLRSHSVAQNVAPVAAILAFGTAMNGLMNVPYAMQLAKGYTRVPFFTAVIVAILFVPCMVWAAGNYGPIGAAWTWFALNLLYLIVGVAFTHLLIVPGQFRLWLLRDTGLPLLAIVGMSAAVAWMHSFFFPGTVGKILFILSGSAAILLAAVLSAQDIRGLVRSRVQQLMQRTNGSA